MLRDAFNRGRSRALVQFKIAQGMPPAVPHPAPAPAPRPQASWADMRQGVQQAQAANVTPRAAPLPTPAPAAVNTSSAAPAQTAGAPRKFMQPLKQGLGLAALGTAGAVAYGMHNQNEEDRAAHNLVYAPTQGAY